MGKVSKIIIVFIGLKCWELLYSIVYRPWKFLKNDLIEGNDRGAIADCIWTVIMSLFYFAPFYWWLFSSGRGSTLENIFLSLISSFLTFWVLAILFLKILPILLRSIVRFLKDNWQKATNIVEKRGKK